MNKNNVNSFTNFLKNPSVIKSNLKLDENGEILICDNNGDFSMVLKDSPFFKVGKTFCIECIAISGKGFFVAGENAMIF